MAYEVELTGLEKLDELIAKTEKLGEAMGGLKERTRSVGDEAETTTRKRRSDPEGMYTRQERYRAEFSGMESEGITGGAAYNDARARMIRADRSVERFENSLQPKSQEQKLMDVLMTSRIGAGGQLQPLVGRMLSAGLLDQGAIQGMLGGLTGAAGGLGGAVGTGGMASAGGAATQIAAAVTSQAAARAAGSIPAPGMGARGLGVAGAAAAASASGAGAAGGGIAGMIGGAAALGGGMVAGLGFFGLAASVSASAISRQREKSALHWGAGGDAAASGALMGFGALLGESPGAMASQAVAFGDTLRSGGYGAAYFRQRGLVDRGVWQTDKASNYAAAMRMLADEPDDSTAIRVARDVGMSDKLWLRDLDPGMRERVLRAAEGSQSPSARRSAANAQAGQAMRDAAWDRIHTEIGDYANRVFGNMTGGSMDWTAPIRGMFPFVWAGIESMFGGARTAVESVAGPAGKKGKPSRSDAGEFGENVGRAASQGPEMIGGGPRARGAVPAGWKQIQMSDALDSGAVNLGAFNV